MYSICAGASPVPSVRPFPRHGPRFGILTAPPPQGSTATDRDSRSPFPTIKKTPFES